MTNHVPSFATASPRRVLVGVGGGIAAFKAPHLVRYFTEAGVDVRVVPTPAALKFVGAPTFEALSHHPVSTEVFDDVESVQHVRLGQEADLIVIAPATADLLARLAHGRADDLLTSSCLVATCPIVVAPAMHTEMWCNPATQANVDMLRSRGITVLHPAHGRLTGTDTGPGRMLEPDHIGALALAAYRSRPGAFDQSLAGVKVVVSAGGTHEPLDPVRFLGNSSSGKQGYALADIAAQRGAEVHIVAGVTENLPLPPGAQVTKVGTALEMHRAMEHAAADADVVIMAAAVADYRPGQVAGAKLKKGSAANLSTLELVENPDILRSLVQSRGAERRPLLVGFAAETGDTDGDPLHHGLAKLKRKGCDMIMCNAVGEGKVFGQEDSSGWILVAPPAPGEDATSRAQAEGGARVIGVPNGHKLDVSIRILDVVEHLLERDYRAIDRLV
ncbi:bifunctional phosphopantothenoylcysteine decarboxylase/phosphopantothenate--cysteine ligase CoaBC [Corynebacterium heidelbergense]|uniref:Coenzyme A biosynthesis bifunctional protein CoaBC n=1 Tax=Corynebacterium heidelbergense TaxID=2055947 RepID=A0A364V948_9CORY|nr:bifunctional phosphopantothenoylcysteine decarboxylase/phosphopantothenate--cysteine ligase CoaBC [Corynebacterium heidelbergense]RAV33151.1 bifunctional phosphopantothenoylcysteine decarboxylase/phosphopantothenate--cysteine ligase CoaBC [Corynebacterium heidelbergense]